MGTWRGKTRLYHPELCTGEADGATAGFRGDYEREQSRTMFDGSLSRAPGLRPAIKCESSSICPAKIWGRHPDEEVREIALAQAKELHDFWQRITPPHGLRQRRCQRGAFNLPSMVRTDKSDWVARRNASAAKWNRIYR